MKILFLLAGIILGLIVLTGIILYLIGRAEPERHTASIKFALPKAPRVVWAALTDYAAMPQWWPAVKSVRFETRSNGEVITWNTDARSRQIGFRTKEEQAPVRLVREIVSDDLPFGGIWTFELVEEKGVTSVTLTEDGFIKPPLFRGISKLFLKHDATMHDFEKNFTAHLANK